MGAKRVARKHLCKASVKIFASKWGIAAANTAKVAVWGPWPDGIQSLKAAVEHAFPISAESSAATEVPSRMQPLALANLAPRAPAAVELNLPRVHPGTSVRDDWDAASSVESFGLPQHDY